MYDLKCILCSKDFQHGLQKGKVPKFCSRKCYLENRWGQHIKTKIIQCRTCEKNMEVTTGKKSPIFCSRKCKDTHEVVRATIYVMCIQCSTQFTVKRGEKKAGRGKYCSRTCFQSSDKQKEIIELLKTIGPQSLKNIPPYKRTPLIIAKQRATQRKRWREYHKKYGRKKFREHKHIKNRKYVAWRMSVFERDGYVCQKTGIKGGRIVAHHIVNWMQDKSLRYEISNGITLSDTAHRLFHKLYGRKNNNYEQIKEFINIKEQQ